MNVGTYLLLTVPLVGGSLYVYDSVRPDPAPVLMESAPLAAPSRRAESAEPSGPLLQADPSAQVERLVREAVERMRQEQLASGRTTGVLPSAGSDGALPATPPLALGSDPEAVEGPGATFDEKTMRVFRAYMQEAWRLREEEQRVQRIQTALTTMGVSLSDSQRTAVVAATLKLRSQRLELAKKFPGAENNEARNKAVQELRTDYSKTIHDIAPAVEAEKIVNELAGNRGWGDAADAPAGGPRRVGGGNGRNRPGDQGGDAK